jgi:lincosamide nucleotidyltransferase A/C/D/E
MTASAVLDAMAALRGGGIAAWVAGGWAVDAVVGEQTRPHRDLDLAVRFEQLDATLEILAGLGYETSLDLLPVRLVVTDAGGRTIDLHPVLFDASGHGRQSGGGDRVFDYPPDGFGEGTIDGVAVPCLSAEQLVRFHLGYEPLGHDRRDMDVLRDRLGIDVPAPY